MQGVAGAVVEPGGDLIGDQPGGGEVTADGRSGHTVTVVALEVPGDGFRPGVQTRVGQVLTDPHDEVDDPRR